MVSNSTTRRKETKAPQVDDLHDPYAEDLRWLLGGEYLGDLGVRSNLGGIIESLERGYVAEGNPAGGVPDHVLFVATRLRRLEHRWRLLDERHQYSLQVRYGTTRRVVAEWGDIGNLILSRCLVHQEHAKSRTTRNMIEWLARNATASSPVAARLREDAERALSDAQRAWALTAVHVGRRR